MSSELKTLIKSLGPVFGKAVAGGQLFRPKCELTQPPPDILCEYDVVVPVGSSTQVKPDTFF